MKLIKLFLLSFFVICTVVGNFAAFANSDTSGSKDHPLLSRYPDTHIIQYAELEYDKFDIAIGPNNVEKRYPQVKNLEGKITSITYKANTPKITPIQIISNYKQALNNYGFKELYSCKSKNDGCGNGFKYDFYAFAPQSDNYSSFSSNSSDKKFHFYSGVLEDGKNKTYVSIGTLKYYSNHEAMVAVDIVEIIPMETGLINISKQYEKAKTQENNHGYKDQEGSSDHPTLSRYPNTHIIQYSSLEYDEFDIPVGPNNEENDYPQVKNLEGKITSITYEANTPNITPVQIISNYKQALNKAGFKELYSCKNKNDGCGDNFKYDFYKHSPQSDNYTSFSSNSGDNKFHFYSGVIEDGKNKTYVSVGAVKYYSQHNTLIALDIVEIIPMEDNLIQTSDFSSSFGKYGKATLSGILFDTGKATIKKESQKAIDEIGDFLTKNSGIKVYIVGHTDNTHTYEHNITLSQQRASAVVDALVKKGIKVDRMQPIGIGPVSPVSTNATKDGRALNRRVEMVLMGN